METYVTAFLLLAIGFQSVLAAQDVTFPFGIIQGVDLQSKTNNKPLSGYYGIPYAMPPVGKLRFQRPVPYTGDPSQVISSTSFRPACMQGFAGDIDMSEDCLHLNVFAPPRDGNLKKVLVWIHGGGYVNGDAMTYVPTDLVADQNMVVVTFQYRLHHFGFAGTGDAFSSFNNGLRDQIMALQWVKDNIDKFEGDGGDITAYGESAGASSLGLLSVSPYGNGLFTKAIMESGSPINPWATFSKKRSLERFYEFAEDQGCLSWYYKLLPGGVSSIHHKIVECLQGKPAKGMVNKPEDGGIFGFYSTLKAPASADQSAPIIEFMKILAIRPTIDGDVVPYDPNYLLNNVKYLKDNGVLDRTYLIGTNNNEGEQFQQPPFMGYYNSEENLKKLADMSVRDYFPFTYNDEQKRVIEFVYGYPKDENGRPPAQGIFDLQTDAWILFSSQQFVVKLAKASKNTNVYQYVFDYYPLLENGESLQGTPHAGDLLFVFDENPALMNFITRGQNLKFDMADMNKMRAVVGKAMSQFVQTGTPSCGTPNDWPRFDLADRYYMSLNTQCEARKRIYSKRMSLWEDYLPRIQSKLFKWC